MFLIRNFSYQGFDFLWSWTPLNWTAQTWKHAQIVDLSSRKWGSVTDLNEYKSTWKTLSLIWINAKGPPGCHFAPGCWGIILQLEGSHALDQIDFCTVWPLEAMACNPSSKITMPWPLKSLQDRSIYEPISTPRVLGVDFSPLIFAVCGEVEDNILAFMHLFGIGQMSCQTTLLAGNK